MRYKEPFSLYQRPRKNGKPVYYFRIYDAQGKRLSGRSTGQTSKALARKYVVDLISTNGLPTRNDIRFSAFSDGWWVWDKCAYIKGQKVRGRELSRGYADTQLSYLLNHIKPAFDGMPLSKIRSGDIESWLYSLKAVERLSSTTANHCLATLRIMLGEAVRLQLIHENPVKGVRPLRREPVIRNILTVSEARTLFSQSLQPKHWNNALNYTACLLAASTGMRLGEILALPVQNVHEHKIDVEFSWSHKYGIKGTKTGTTRIVPIPSTTYEWLIRITDGRADGFVFSTNAGKSPVYYKVLTSAYYAALENIGIHPDKRKARNLTFHSLRHFFNSMMRGKVDDAKLRMITGHATTQMMNHYTHLSSVDYEEVITVQEKLLF